MRNNICLCENRIIETSVTLTIKIKDHEMSEERKNVSNILKIDDSFEKISSKSHNIKAELKSKYFIYKLERAFYRRKFI